MENSSKHTSFLATSSKKFFKVGLACALALTIVAFKLPFYSASPSYSFSPQKIEGGEVFAIELLATKPAEKKLDLNKVKVKAPIINIILDNEPPSPIIESVITAVDVDDLTLDPEFKVEPKPILKEEKHTVVEIMPEFKGGEGQLFSYLGSKLQYSEEMLYFELEGKVYIRFVIDKKGKVTNAEVAKGVHKLLDAKALEVVKNMPDWNAGIQNGENVNVVMVLPINFELR